VQLTHTHLELHTFLYYAQLVLVIECLLVVMNELFSNKVQVELGFATKKRHFIYRTCFYNFRHHGDLVLLWDLSVPTLNNA
jgi:hypothetical protein